MFLWISKIFIYIVPNDPYALDTIIKLSDYELDPHKGTIPFDYISLSDEDVSAFYGNYTSTTQSYSSINISANQVQIGENTYYNSQLILSSYGLDNYTVNYDNQSTSLKETITMLQDGRLDGFFLNSVIPLNIIKQLSETTKIRFVDITGVNKLLIQYPDYKITDISKSVYPKANNPNSTKTLSVMTSIVTSSKTSNYAAYIIAKEIVENLHILKTLHPSLRNLNIKEMLKYNTAPIHPGAMRYYVDNGLLN